MKVHELFEARTIVDQKPKGGGYINQPAATKSALMKIENQILKLTATHGIRINTSDAEYGEDVEYTSGTNLWHTLSSEGAFWCISLVGPEQERNEPLDVTTLHSDPEVQRKMASKILKKLRASREYRERRRALKGIISTVEALKGKKFGAMQLSHISFYTPPADHGQHGYAKKVKISPNDIREIETRMVPGTVDAILHFKELKIKVTKLEADRNES